MGSSLYDVTVRGVTDDRAELEVTVVHPDAGPVTEDLGFAFTLLCDPIVDHRGSLDGGPLARELDLADYLDESFVARHAGGFVASSRIVEERHHPPPRWDDDGYEAFWDSEARAMAVLRIVPTHRAWIAHLQPGQRWDTATYARRGVARWERGRWPGDRLVVPSDDLLEGMVVKGRDERLAGKVRGAELDTFVIPAFGSLHYETVDPLVGETLTVEGLRRWLGQPVLAEKHDGGRAVGMLTEVSDQGWFMLYTESDGGSSGSSGQGLSECRAVGRARYLRRHDVTADMPPELERQLRANPDDVASWLVYADRLMDAGDPLGPLLRARYG